MNKQSRVTGILTMLGASLCFSTGGVLIKLIPWNSLAINGVRNGTAQEAAGHE